jgi:hypothetical protein
MRIAEWKTFWEEVLDGVQRELSPADSAEKAALDTFRIRLDKPSIPRRRKKFEDELDEVLQSNAVLKLALDRYLRKKVPAAIAAAEAALEAGQERLAKLKRKKSRTWVN